MISNNFQFPKGSSFFVSYTGGTYFTGGQFLKTIEVIFDRQIAKAEVSLMEPQPIFGMSKVVQYPRIGIYKTIIKESAPESFQEIGSCLLFSDCVVCVTHQISLKAIFLFPGNPSSFEETIAEFSSDIYGNPIQGDRTYEIQVVREGNLLISRLVPTEKELMNRRTSVASIASGRMFYFP